MKLREKLIATINGKGLYLSIQNIFRLLLFNGFCLEIKRLSSSVVRWSSRMP